MAYSHWGIAREEAGGATWVNYSEIEGRWRPKLSAGAVLTRRRDGRKKIKRDSKKEEDKYVTSRSHR
jgi:hypothetical protein